MNYPEFEKFDLNKKEPSIATPDTIPYTDKPDLMDQFMALYKQLPECPFKQHIAEWVEFEPKEEESQEEWISVKDRLPENTNDVLCFEPLNHQFVGKYTKGHELDYWDDDYDGEYDPIEDQNGTLYLEPGWYENEETPGGDYDTTWVKREVTHWMPLPSPPKLK
jgi:hypothetical protein